MVGGVGMVGALVVAVGGAWLGGLWIFRGGAGDGEDGVVREGSEQEEGGAVMMGEPMSLPMRSADALLLMLQLMALVYFSLVTFRSGAGRMAMVLMVAAVVEFVFRGFSVLMEFAGHMFSYSSGTETTWMALMVGGTAARIIPVLAMAVAAVAFLMLALRAKKSRRG